MNQRGVDGSKISGVRSPAELIDFDHTDNLGWALKQSKARAVSDLSPKNRTRCLCGLKLTLSES